MYSLLVSGREYIANECGYCFELCMLLVHISWFSRSMLPLFLLVWRVRFSGVIYVAFPRVTIDLSDPLSLFIGFYRRPSPSCCVLRVPRFTFTCKVHEARANLRRSYVFIQMIMWKFPMVHEGWPRSLLELDLYERL